MRSISPLKKILIFGAIILLFILIIILLNFKIAKHNYYEDYVLPENKKSNNEETPKIIKADEDIDNEKGVKQLNFRLLIPKLKIDATLGEVGITSQAAVGTPDEPWLPAWFNLGSLPGDVGTSIIVGHSGIWKNGQKTIFDNLSNLTMGDKIYIEDEKGLTKIFVVKKLLSYNQNDNVPEVFYSEDNKAHLNLITCDGIWDNVSKSYSKRLVIFTDLE